MLKKQYYKDTFSFNLAGDREFQIGDKVLIGIAKNTYTTDKIIPVKVINISETQPELNVTFTPEEMQPVKPGNYFLEVKLVYSDIVETIIQEEIVIKGVVIDEIPN